MEDRHEFIPARPVDLSPVSDGQQKAVRRAPDQFVSGVVPDRVVDRLQAVHVRRQHHQISIQRALPVFRQILFVAAPVVQPGQLVRHRDLDQALLPLLFIVDVSCGEYDPQRQAAFVHVHRDVLRPNPPVEHIYEISADELLVHEPGPDGGDVRILDKSFQLVRHDALPDPSGHQGMDMRAVLERVLDVLIIPYGHLGIVWKIDQVYIVIDVGDGLQYVHLVLDFGFLRLLQADGRLRHPDQRVIAHRHADD